MESHALNLVRTLLSFQQRSLFCDTVITAKNQLVFAHSAVLAATCPALYNLLNQQPFNSQKTNVLELEKFDSDLIEDLLKLLYTGHIDANRALKLQEICQLLGVTLNLSDSQNTDTGSAVLNEEYRKESDKVLKSDPEIRGNGKIRKESSLMSVVADLRVGRSEVNVGYETKTAERGRKSCLRAAKSEIYGFNSSDIPRVPRKEESAFNEGATVRKPNEEGLYCTQLSEHRTQESNPLQKHDKQKYEKEIIPATQMDFMQENGPIPSAKSVQFTFVCSLCEASFQTQRALNVHKYSHNVMDDGSYQCHICSKAFSVREYLRKHIRGHCSKPVAKQAKKYSCSSCQKKFRTAARLDSHINTHTGKKPFICVICGKGYADKEYLAKHQRLHRNEKPYLCDDCGVGFAFRQSYTSHCRLHTGEKPYVCSECNHAFVQSSALRSHLRVHANPDCLTCSQCLKAFASARRLALHIMSVHTQQEKKEHKCPECSKFFTRHYLLLRHIQTHSKPYECNGCSMKFHCQLKWRQHVKGCKF